MNLHKGLKRLTLVLSVSSGPIFTIYLLAIGNEPVDFGDFIYGVLFFCGGGFLTVWAIYGMALWVIVPVVRWIVTGFHNANNVEKKSNG